MTVTVNLNGNTIGTAGSVTYKTDDFLDITSTSLTSTSTPIYTFDFTNFQASTLNMQAAFANVGTSMQKMVQAMGVPTHGMRPPLGFNRYVNGSDLLEEFIKFLGEQGVRQREMASIPVELFIRWLVIRACEEDQEEPPVMLELPAPMPQPRCLGCQRFMAKATVLPMHDQRCSDLYFTRQLVAA